MVGRIVAVELAGSGLLSLILFPVLGMLSVDICIGGG